MFSGLLSHPDRYIEEHLSNVLEIGLKFFQDIYQDKVLKDVFSIILFSHDLGKTTDYFQRYIQGEKVDKKLKNHSLLGAVVSLYLTDRYLKTGQIEDKFLLVISFVVPKRHHSDLQDFMDDLVLDDDDIDLLKQQIETIDKEKFKVFLENLKIENKDIFYFNFDEIDLEKIKNLVYDLRRFVRKEIRKSDKLDYYVNALLFYSLLLDADKSDVGIKTDKDVLFKKFDLKPDVVANYVENLPKQDNILYNLRQQAYTEIKNQEVDLKHKIYTLNLPTGIGKTLLSFKYALKIADKFKQETGKDLRIIYVLPFLSVIEQNHKVIENLLKHSNINVDNSLLLKYHHLTGFNYKDEEEILDYDTSRILTEGFNSKIIITTFMQFFYSIIGNKKGMVRKFHRLTNSVVILDEVQSIPTKYWLLIREVLNFLAERFNFYVIYTTATLPDIFINGKNLTQGEYFNKLNRYQINIDLSQKTVSEFCSNLQLQHDKSYLFILNTVSSAKEVYNFLKQKYPDQVIYLSTHIIPKERLKRIQALKDKLKPIAVSTQLVEAGVDIDFDVVYRDFSPLDSIIQSAGRCNREGLREKGLVYVINLIDDKNRKYSSYVYDTVLLEATKDVLTKDLYDEIEIQELVKRYYRLLNERKYQDRDILKSATGLVFSGENSIEDFLLIEEDKYKQDVFIQLDDRAVEVWNEFKKVLTIENLFERKKAFNSIKKDFYEYVVSVPIKNNEPNKDGNFYVVHKSELEGFYDEETGYKVKGDIFLEY